MKDEGCRMTLIEEPPFGKQETGSPIAYDNLSLIDSHLLYDFVIPPRP